MYANCIWYPYLKRQSISIEKNQRRATRILSDCSGMSYGERLKFLNLHSLKGRRIRGDLILAYKIFNGIVDFDVKDIFTLSYNNRNRLSQRKIFIEHTNLSKSRIVFRHRIAKLWNNLPTNVKNIDTIDHFNLLRIGSTEILNLVRYFWTMISISHAKPTNRPIYATF